MDHKRSPSTKQLIWSCNQLSNYRYTRMESDSSKHMSSVLRVTFYSFCAFYSFRTTNRGRTVVQGSGVSLGILHIESMNRVRVIVIVFNATFNNISAISWRSVLLVEETEVPGENHQPVASHWQTISHNVVSSTPRMSWFELTTLVVIGRPYWLHR
jgi:hypothetical protein